MIIINLCYLNEKYLKVGSTLVRVSTLTIKPHDQTQHGAERIDFILYLSVVYHLEN